MNICLISDKQIYKFVLNYEMNLKYIKKLCYKLFKTEDLDIYYKDKNIFEKYNENTILDDIINEHDSIIKFKIIFHSFCSSKIQTPSTTNSQTTNIIEIGGSHNNEKKNKKVEIKSIINLKQNKLFEAVYTQKFKKLSSLMNEFNLKVIEMGRFLFKKKEFSENRTFEKKIYQFVEGAINYYQKLISILEKNDYLSYDEIVYNLKYFYNHLEFNKENESPNHIKEKEQIMNYKTMHEEDDFIINSSKSQFPINLKKSEKITTINNEKSNMFNKKSKKISIKDKLLSNEKIDSKISFFNKKIKNDAFDIMEAKDSSNKIIINITDLSNKNIKKKIKFDELNFKKVDSEEYSIKKINKKIINENININIKTEKEEVRPDNIKKADKLAISGDLLKKSSDSLKKIVEIKNKSNNSIKLVKSQKSDESKKAEKVNKIINNDNDNDNKNEIIDKKESKNKLNNIKTSKFKFEPKSENENENDSNSSERSAKYMKSNYNEKLFFNSTIKESESEEWTNKFISKKNSLKNEEDNKSDGVLDENEIFDKKTIDKLKKNLSKKKSLNPNVLKIMKLSSKEDEIEDAKKKLRPVIYHFSQKNLNFARTISKKLLKKKSKNNIHNKFDFLI